MLRNYEIVFSKTRPISKRLRHIINESMCVADNISILTINAQESPRTSVVG